jgi:hypothetical protein
MRFSRKRILSVLFAVCLLFPAVPAPAFADGASGPPESGGLAQTFSEAEESGACAPDELLVVFNENIGEPAAENAIEATDGEILDIAKLPGDDALAALVEPPRELTLGEAAAEIARNPSVAFVQPNYLYELADGEAILPAAFVSDDPQMQTAARRRHLENIDAAGAWAELAAAGPKPRVRVAVLDNNVYRAHEDLAANINEALAKDFGGGVADPAKNTGYGMHGTHVAGIIGAAANNGKGVAGVASGAAGGIVEIIPINVFSGESASSYALANAIGYAAGEGGAKVINMSLGFVADPNYDPYLRNAVSNAVSSGVTVVCAAGNVTPGLTPPFPVLPSDFDGVIGVVNLAADGSRHKLSNYGGARDISAPGTDIYSTSTSAAGGSEYIGLTGTSMASPVVAGVAAMMLYVNGNLSPAEVENILESTAVPLADATATGGMVNAAAAVRAVRTGLMPSGTVTVTGASGAGGAPRFNDALAADANVTSPNPGALSYQWKRDGAAIDGATGPSHTVVVADIGHSLSVTVTAQNCMGGLTSDATPAVQKAAAPAVSWPTAQDITYGQPLSASSLGGGSADLGGFAWTDPAFVPEAGSHPSVSVTFTPSADTLSKYEMSAHTGNVSLTVNKAPAPRGVNRTFYVKAEVSAQSYDFDLSALLPSVIDPTTADVSYALGDVTDTPGVLNAPPVAPVSGHNLPLSVNSGVTDLAAATVPVTIQSRNYADFVSVLTVKASVKDVIEITGLTAEGTYVHDGEPKPGYTGTHGFSGGTPSNFVLTAHYTGTPNGAAANGYDGDAAPTAAGIYGVHLELLDDDYYAEWTGNFTIEKAVPQYAPPAGLSAEYGKTLAEVALPEGFAWKTPETPVGDVAASRGFDAVFTPSDTNNYKTADATLPVAVTKKPLTVAGLTAVSRAYDGTKSVALMGGRLGGIVAGDEGRVGFTLGDATLSDKAPGAGKPVSVAVALTGERAPNYTVALSSPVAADIAKKPIAAGDLVIAAPDKAYDGTDTASLRAEFVSGTVVAGEDLRVVLTGRYADANAGTGKPVTVTAWRLEGNDAANYVLDGPLPSGIAGSISSAGGGGFGGGGGGGGGGGTASEDRAKEEPAKETPAKTGGAEAAAPVATVAVESRPTLDADTGRAVAKIETEAVIKAAETAAKAAAEAAAAGRTNASAEVRLVAKSEAANGAPLSVRSAEIDIPAEAVRAVAAAKNLVLTAESDLSTITLDSAALTGVAAAAKDGDTVRITAETVERTGTDDARLLEKAGNNAVIELTVSVGGSPVRDFAGSVTVSLPCEPGADLRAEDLDLLTVYFLDEEGGIREMRGARYDARTGRITFVTEHFSKFFVSEWINPFADIAKGDWFYKNARFAYSNGLMDGVAENAFAPLSNLTRAMFVTMLHRSEGGPAAASAAPFSDVQSGQWYAEAAAWARANGVVSGYGDGRFGADDPVTREQIAAMLYNLALRNDPGLAKPAALTGYADASEISPWATEAAAWANARGLLTGRASGILAPKETATRAEAAALLQRFAESAD